MMNKLSFLLKSTIQSIRSGKVMSGFLALSYAVGLLLPTAILCASYWEISQIKSTVMIDSERIISVEDQIQFQPLLFQNEEGRISERELYNKLLQLDPSVESVSFKSEHSSVFSDGEQYRYVNVTYVDSTFIDNYRGFMKRGEWFNEENTNSCIVGTSLSRQLWRGSGLNKEIQVGGVKCTVVGETETYDNRILLRDDGRDNITGMTKFYVKVKSTDSVDTVIAKINKLGGQYQTEKMDVFFKQYLSHAYAGFSLIFLLSLITLFYSILNISNIIALLQSERRKKYGIQMAIGAKKRHLYFEFYSELLIITTISLVAVFGAIFLAKPLIESYLYSIRIDQYVIFIIFVLNMIVCAIMGLIFMRKIVKNNIVKLIRESD